MTQTMYEVIIHTNWNVILDQINDKYNLNSHMFASNNMTTKMDWQIKIQPACFLKS